jgi:hypothetical protein
LRERDIEQFAGELATIARRNPGVFLAGSVALGFGVARFFRARAPQPRSDYAPGFWQNDSSGEKPIDDDAEESLDLSASSQRGGNDPSNRQRAFSDGEDDRASTGEADDSPPAGGERS